MTSPATGRPNRAATFNSLFESAATAYGHTRTTAAHTIQIGLDPHQIIDFVRGRLDPAGRRDLQSMLLRSEWVNQRIIALVKARRNPRSLGAHILATTGRVDPTVWGIRPTGDPDLDLAKLLDQV